MNNQEIYNSICVVNGAVSDRVTQDKYKDVDEERLLFYISQALFLAINFSQDILDKEKEGEK